MQNVLDFVFNFHFVVGVLVGAVLRPYIMILVAKLKK